MIENLLSYSVRDEGEHNLDHKTHLRAWSQVHPYKNKKQFLVGALLLDPKTAPVLTINTHLTGMVAHGLGSLAAPLLEIGIPS